MNDNRQQSIIFSNEFCDGAYVPREPRETLEDWQWRWSYVEDIDWYKMCDFLFFVVVVFFTKDEKYGQLLKILFKKKNLSVLTAEWFHKLSRHSNNFCSQNFYKKKKMPKKHFKPQHYFFFIIFSYSFDVQSFLVSLDFCFVLFFISILKRGSFFFEGAFTMVLL